MGKGIKTPEGHKAEIEAIQAQVVGMYSKHPWPGSRRADEEMGGGCESWVYVRKTTRIGHMVKAKVKLSTGENAGDFRQRMHAFCREKLPKFKIPRKIVLVNETMYGDRFKKIR